MFEFSPTDLTLIGTVISAASAAFALSQAHSARRQLRQLQVLQLFDRFDSANRATLDFPDLLRSVHGLPESIPMEEARAIAYLSALLDAFQHFYGHLYKSDFGRMVKDMSERSNFLTRILAHPANRARWARMKELYYGEFDRAFVDAIETVLTDEYKRERTRG
jgi:hypothetical protein